MSFHNEKETFNQSGFLIEASPSTEEKQDEIINSIKGDWYDKQEIDLSDENNIVIAYKKNDTTILTETIVIDGDNITINKT
jgi:hypothetical protein